MIQQWLSWFWHRVLGRPYRLAVPIDRGEGQPVVLLHGLLGTHRKWNFVNPYVKSNSRVIALDLLGFGASPKPEDCDYTAADHARAVIATLRAKGIRKEVILVGHSMGALVAVEIAKQKPQLVKQLVLCGMPIYKFDAVRGLMPNQESIYQRMYTRMVQDEKLAWGMIKLNQRISRVALEEFGINRSELYAAQRSLANTIMQQTTFNDIQKLKVPLYLIGGRLDALVIRQHLKTLNKLVKGSTLEFLNERHDITANYGRYVAEVVDALVEGRAVRSSILKPSKLPKPALFKKKKNSTQKQGAEIEKI